MLHVFFCLEKRHCRRYKQTPYLCYPLSLCPQAYAIFVSELRDVLTLIIYILIIFVSLVHFSPYLSFNNFSAVFSSGPGYSLSDSSFIMISVSQNMALVETMAAPLLPVAPLMQDIPYETRGAFHDLILENIQQASGRNFEETVQPQEIAHDIHELESDGFLDLPTKTSVPKSIVPIQEDLSCLTQVTFDPSKHIQFTPPSKIWTMKELDYPEDQGISPVGVSEPFPLFSAEAVKQMRAEILSENVWNKYKFSSNLSDCMLRGYAPE